MAADPVQTTDRTEGVDLQPALTSPSTSSLSPSTASLSPSTASLSPPTVSFSSDTPTRPRGISSASSLTIASTASASGVVTPKRQAEFEKYFKDDLINRLSPGLEGREIPDGYLQVVATQSADLQARILIHGRLYLTRYHLCFRANILGYKTVKIHPLKDVISVEKGTTAKWIQNAVYIVLDPSTTEEGEEESDYGSLGDRDAMFDDVVDSWKVCAPERYDTFLKAQLPVDGGDDDGDEEEDEDEGDMVLKHTQCSGEHYDELAIDTKIAIEPKQLYDLLYHNREFITEFFEKDKKLTEVVISEWHEDDGKEKRDLTYVMHMNNTIGPSQSDCIGSEKVVVCDPDTAYEILSETQTPGVPTGKNVHGKAATKMYCTTQCDWSASSMLKGTITSAVIKGQKEYHHQLTKKIRQWIKDHPDDYGGVAAVQEAHLQREQDEKSGVDVDLEHSTAPIVDDKKLLDHAIGSRENGMLLLCTALLVFLLTMWFSKSWYGPRHLQLELMDT